MQLTKRYITDVAKEYGVSRRALRFYEQKGYLNPARFGTSRRYTDNDLVRIGILITGKKLGFTLHEISIFLPAPSASVDRQPIEVIAEAIGFAGLTRQIEFLERERDTVDAAIDELKAALSQQDRGADLGRGRSHSEKIDST